MREYTTTDKPLNEHLSMAKAALRRAEARIQLNELGYAVTEYDSSDDQLKWRYAGNSAIMEKSDPCEEVVAPNGVKLIVTKDHPWGQNESNL